LSVRLPDKSLIGNASEPQVFEVERGAIRRFADAIGDPEPAHRAGDVAPPTFPTSFRVPVPGLNVDPSHFLHGGEEYQYERPLRPGDSITCVRRVMDVFERKGRMGPMAFVISELEGRDAHGEAVFRGRSTLIVH
jgi:acyl dehydratase